MGGGHSQNVRPNLVMTSILGPLFWECPYLRALPYTQLYFATKRHSTIVSLGVSQTTKPKEFLKGVHISNYACKLNLVNVNFVGLMYQRKTQHT